MLFERKVRDERAVWNDDDLALLQIVEHVHEIGVLVDADHFVDEGERPVQPLRLAVGDGERFESLVVRAFENLERRVRAERGDRILPVHNASRVLSR